MAALRVVAGLAVLHLATAPVLARVKGRTAPTRRRRPGCSSCRWPPRLGSRRSAIFLPEHQQWLQTVRGLITWRELDYFLRLDEGYRRDAFIEAFWEPRDPDPRTPENELQARWQTLASRGRFSLGRSALPAALVQRRPRRLDASRRPPGRPLPVALAGPRDLVLRLERAPFPALPGDHAAADDRRTLRGLPPGREPAGGPPRRRHADPGRPQAVRRRSPRLHPGRDRVPRQLRPGPRRGPGAAAAVARVAVDLLGQRHRAAGGGRDLRDRGRARVPGAQAKPHGGPGAALGPPRTRPPDAASTASSTTTSCSSAR